ncbi:MAG: FAD-dependent oxidoreductase [Chthoniobacterales bacterium]
MIGAGTGGLVTAAGSVALGERVALVERNRMGGDCLNLGCVPSKALIFSARLLDRMRHADKWGRNSIFKKSSPACAHSRRHWRPSIRRDVSSR